MLKVAIFKNLKNKSVKYHTFINTIPNTEKEIKKKTLNEKTCREHANRISPSAQTKQLKIN